MTYNQNNKEIVKNERYYQAVEMDVRQCMKEACSAYKNDTQKVIYHYRHIQARKKLAGQIGRLLAASMAILFMVGCGLNIEAYRYSPDEFVRINKKQPTSSASRYYDETDQRRSAK